MGINDHNRSESVPLDTAAVSMACAIVGGLFGFWYTWLITKGKRGRIARKLLAVWIPGYKKPPIGSVVSFLWAYMAGLIGGGMYAHLYNMFSKESKI